MSRRTGTINTEYFETLYAKDADPWKFETSEYEQKKYDATLTTLQRQDYGAALEVGASIGIFTRRLAPLCKRLIALEPSSRALSMARDRLAEVENITFVQGTVPDDLPEGPFDLIVLSEVLYYLAKDDALATMQLCCSRMRPSGEIVLCHWLGETDYPLTGDEAATLALGVAAERGLSTETLRHPNYRLDHLRAPA